MTPTHIKSHTSQLMSTAWGAGFTLPVYSEPIQKLILRREDSESLDGHLHGGGEERKGRTWAERRGEVEEWHHLPWNVTIISSLSPQPSRKVTSFSLYPPPSFPSCVPSKAGWWGSVVVCVHKGVRTGKHFLKRQIQAEASVCLRTVSLSSPYLL